MSLLDLILVTYGIAVTIAWVYCTRLIRTMNLVIKHLKGKK